MTVASNDSRGSHRPGDLEAFAVECALDAAWATEFWRPTDPDYGFVDYFEAAAARNISLLRGFEELGDSATRRGILPGVESEQARLATDGGDDWNPEPVDLRDDEQDDAKTKYRCARCSERILLPERPLSPRSPVKAYCGSCLAKREFYPVGVPRPEQLPEVKTDD
jgi:DNA-directed RNA polymerase subunit RPC12/RpoP